MSGEPLRWGPSHSMHCSCFYPMAYLIRQSVLDPDTGSFTLAYFTKFFSKSYYFDTLINSFKVSITATVLSIAIGTPLAYLFTIFKIKGKSVLNILIVVASMSAPFIGAYSWILLLGRSGIITTFFKTSASPSRTSTASAVSCWS